MKSTRVCPLHWLWTGWLWVLLLLIAVACQRETPRAKVPPKVMANQAQEEAARIHSQLHLDVGQREATLVTPSPEVQTEPATTEAPSLAPPDETAPEPLRFVFPESNGVPISAWRPALYPTPWALTPQDHFYFARPIAADEINWPLPDYRYGGNFFANIVHTGVDIPTPVGTPVLAAGPGYVTWAGYGLYKGKVNPSDPYGLAVLIRHDFGYQGKTLYTMYGHLSQVYVVKGQYVNTGEVIGLSGETGKVTGPHLHFEVRLGRDALFTTRNPELWLVPPQGWGVLAGRVMTTNGDLLEKQLVIVQSKQNGQRWRAYSYSHGAIYSDPYYQENLVISDLPAGRYEIRVLYLSKMYTMEIDIYPGMVSYFTFRGRAGLNQEPPPGAASEFSPSP